MKCSSPYKRYLNLKSNELSCLIEQKMHMIIISTGFTLLFYILYNIGRFLINIAIKNIFLSHLVNDDIKVLISINKEELNIPNNKIIEEIKYTKLGNKRKGIIIIIIALIIMISIDILIYIIKTNINY